MAEDTKLKQLIINELTKAQYEALGDNVNEDEIYVITDDDVVKSDGATIVGNGTEADPLAISPEFIEQSINNTINELREQITANSEDIATLNTNKANASDLASHTSNTSNPHSVTKAQVGLGNVDNTADLYKPISTKTQAALNDKADKETTYTKEEVDAKISSVYRFKGSVANQAALPTEEEKPAVGDTYNVEDTGANYAWTGENWDKLSETIDLTPYLTKEDASSTYLSQLTASTTYATKDELNNKADQGDLQSALNLKADKSDTYTKLDVDGAIETVDDKVQKNTEDIAAHDESITTLEASKANASDLTSHTSDVSSNPHKVTKAQVGLGNVDDTSDMSKPVSTAMQEALDLKADKATTYTKTEVDEEIKAVDDKADKNSEDIVAQGNLITNLESNKASASDLSSHISNTSNPHKVDAEQVGLGNVDNTSDADKPISTATQNALDEKQDTLTAGTNITITGTTISAKDTTYTAGDGISITDGVISNTRVSAEWGNVTGDIIAQEDLQNALNLKADKSTTYTKTETQAALNGKQNTLTQAQLNAVNSGITAAKVSKYDNYATEIAGKQPAGDYATNTSLSQGLDGKVDKNQGVASAGKVLAVNEQGVVEPTEIKAGGVNATYDATNYRITFA